jgi:D-alanyl-D-alanine dipeptidase
MRLTRYVKRGAMMLPASVLALVAACTPTRPYEAPSSHAAIAVHTRSDNNASATAATTGSANANANVTANVTGADAPPPVDVIKGTLLRDVPLFADATRDDVLCVARAGDVVLQRFSSGRYALDASITNRCVDDASRSGNVAANMKRSSVWTNASDVDFNDAALAPLLARVNESAQIRIDMAYAGRKIFCTNDQCKITAPLYGKARCYAAPAVTEALTRAAAMLVARDASARLLILDCYRPIDVQIDMFERVNDPVWVARPKPPRYGGHNRGVAIDLTIERDGAPLDMGGAFDAFSDISNYDAKVVSAAAHSNRTLLRDTMIAAGFRPYDAEWWHFSLPIDTRAMNFPL